MRTSLPHAITEHWKKLLVIGIIALGLVWYFAISGGHDHHENRPALSLLVGAIFWISVLIGMLLLTMITRVFDAGWAPLIRRNWELLLQGLPVVIVLGIFPLAFIESFRHSIWYWTDAAHVLPSGHTVGHDPILQAKSWFLNENFFLGRIVFYAIFFGIFAILLRRWSFLQDKNRDAMYTHRLHAVSAVGIPTSAIALTLLAFDCLMALSYHWFSTMYGVWFFSLSIRLALAVTVILTHCLSRGAWLQGLLNQAHRHVLGCLMLAFTVFWAYISFSQYFLIYTANIPEETFWYNIREFDPATGLKNEWWGVSLYLIFGFFFLPFLTLLFYRTKIVACRLVTVAWIIVIGGIVDIWFNAIPRQIHDPSAPEGFSVVPFLTSALGLDLTAILGFGCIVFALYLRGATKHETIPVHDPRILESINYHE